MLCCKADFLAINMEPKIHNEGYLVLQGKPLRVSLYINAFISQEREGGSLAGGPRHNILALGHELRSILQRREEKLSISFHYEGD